MILSPISYNHHLTTGNWEYPLALPFNKTKRKCDKRFCGHTANKEIQIREREELKLSLWLHKRAGGVKIIIMGYKSERRGVKLSLQLHKLRNTI